MQDIIKKYQKYKFINNVNIILASLVLAIWINFLFLDWTNIWQSLKASVTGSNIQKNSSDLLIRTIFYAHSLYPFF